MLRLLIIKSALGVLALLFFVPTYLVALIVPVPHRARWWRMMGVILVQIALWSGRVRIKGDKVPVKGKRPRIYAANHPNEMDGFVLLAYLGSEAVPFTAPLGQFPRLIALWLRYMGAIDVKRDPIDEARHPDSNTKHEALEAAYRALMRGDSIIIFPEGHIERFDALYRLHTGAARLSLATGAPIHVTVIKSADPVFLGDWRHTRPMVGISLPQRLIPSQTYGHEILFTDDGVLRAEVKHLTKRLTDAMLNAMPLRQVKDQFPDHQKDIGVFVDIDRTVYHGLSQLDLFSEWFRTGEFGFRTGLSMLWLFLLEQLRFIPHDEMMNRIMLTMKGWKVERVHRLINHFFRRIALPNLEHGMFATLAEHLARGHHLVFVSEAMHPLADAFGKFFGAEGLIDTPLRRSHGAYTGRVKFLCYGGVKAEGVKDFAKRHGLNLSRSYAYGDSWRDEPFLALVGNPIAVHPDRRLRAYAKKHRIPVLKSPS